MNNPPFFRPMLAGFAVTAGAMLVLPMDAKADAPEGHAAETPSCAAPVPKAGRFHIGRLLAAAQHSGVTQLLTGEVPGGHGGGLLAGAVARTAIEAAAQTPTPAGTPTDTVAAVCGAASETH